jgi:hypothetical protein
VVRDLIFHPSLLALQLLSVQVAEVRVLLLVRVVHLVQAVLVFLVEMVEMLRPKVQAVAEAITEPSLVETVQMA